MTATLPEALPFDAAPGGVFPQIMPAPFRIIFDPTIPAQSGNLYKTWAAAYKCTQEFQGPKVIRIQNAGHIPTAVGQPGNYWDPLGNWSLEIDDSGIILDEGAKFNPVNPPVEIYFHGTAGENGLLQSNATATTPFLSTSSDQTKLTGLLLNGGTVPMFTYTGPLVLENTLINSVAGTATLMSSGTGIFFKGGIYFGATAISPSGTTANVPCVSAPIIVADDLTVIGTNSVVVFECFIYQALSATVSPTQSGVTLLFINQLIGVSNLSFPAVNGSVQISQLPIPGAGNSFTVQAQSSNGSGTGGTLFLLGGNGAGIAGHGGNITFGSGTGNIPGLIIFQLGGIPFAEFTQTGGSSAAFVFAANLTAGIEITQTGVSSGNGAPLLIQAQGTTASGGEGGTATVSGGIAAGASGVGGPGIIEGGPGDPGSGTGGSVFINTGSGFNPGSILFQSAGTTWLTGSLNGINGTLTFAGNFIPTITVANGTTGTGQQLNIVGQEMTGAGATGGSVLVLAGRSLTTIGGSVIVQGGLGGTQNGDVILRFANSTEALRVSGANRDIEIAAPLVGDISQSDPLRFGVSAPISLSGSSTVTLTPTQYQNFTLRFSGTPTGPFNIVFPPQAGYTKVLDFSHVNMSSLTTSLTIKIGGVTVVLPNTFRTTGPVVIMSWDGTSIDLTPAITQTETAANSNGGTSLNSSTFVSVLGTPVTIVTDRTANLDIWASTNLAYSYGAVPPEGAAFSIRILVDGTPILTETLTITAIASPTEVFSQYARNLRLASLVAGAHTIDLQVKGPVVTASSSTFAAINAQASFT